MSGSTPPPGPVLPPCGAWISADDLVACQNDVGSVALAEVSVIASMLMYELSGRQFSGLCGPVTVRPCRNACGPGWGTAGAWSWGYWSGDWGYGWYWGNEAGGRRCGCGYDSNVELAGYPVREVTEVKIGGQVLAPTFDDGSPQYRLDQWRYLTRLSDPASPGFGLHWPACQRLDLEDTEPGTWAVSYTYGVDPPPLGVEAAKQIGCQLLLAIQGKPCSLPANVVQVTRQGASFLKAAPLAAVLRSGGTGLLMVDAFIAQVNPNRLRRRPSVFSPDIPFPVRVGNE